MVAARAQTPPKPGLHPRNRHGAGYDLRRLAERLPALGPLLRRAPHGGLTVDFADPAAVRLLNEALLREAYGLAHWSLPPGALCPPVPGRADYLHHLADLLAADRGDLPRGPQVRLLDVGTGASLIYPILGLGEYGWSFVATDIDPGSLAWAQGLLDRNPALAAAVALRRQPDPTQVFRGVLAPGERFAASVCNPPFFTSARDARQSAADKWRKLGRGDGRQAARNFGGQGAELWCPGGEAGFLERMATESAAVASQVAWFTSLVAKSAHLAKAQSAARKAGAREVRVVPMAQGQKQSRFLAWTFLDQPARRALLEAP